MAWSSTPKSWGIDSDTLLEQYELNGATRAAAAHLHSLPAPQVIISAVDLWRATVLCAAGDTVGVAFDQSDEKVLRIYHNGQYLSGQDVRGMKGETWPIIIVAGGATLEVRCWLRTRVSTAWISLSIDLDMSCDALECLNTRLTSGRPGALLLLCEPALAHSSTLELQSSPTRSRECSMVSWHPGLSCESIQGCPSS